MMNSSTTTTSHSTTTALHPHTTSRESPVGETNDNTFNEVLTIGVPLVIIFVIVLSLCMVLLYSKARRRNAAAQGNRDPLTAISGGVAMNANAYLNYTARDRARYEVETPGGQCPVHSPYILEAPPTYEDVMKQVNTSYNTGVVNMSFTGSTQNVNEVSPPAYEGLGDTDSSIHHTASSSHTLELPVSESDGESRTPHTSCNQADTLCTSCNQADTPVSTSRPHVDEHSSTMVHQGPSTAEHHATLPRDHHAHCSVNHGTDQSTHSVQQNTDHSTLNDNTCVTITGSDLVT